MGTSKKRTPRVEIRRFDNLIGKFPTVSRTGDASRSGKNKIWFTDNDTTAYISGTVVSYPTTLQISSSLLDSDLTSSISISSQVSKGIEQWQDITKQTQNISPYKEYKHFEEDIQDSSFFLTGTSLEIAGDGFTSKLSSKTQIRLQLPLNQQSQLQPASASIYYYNKDIGNFEEIGSSIRHRTIPNFNFWEARLFGPFGNNVLSTSRGSTLSFLSASDSQYGPSAASSLPVSYVNDRLGEMLLAYSTQSLLINPTFQATSSQYVKASDYISHPFLIEKMSIEFPIKTGPGWHGDITTIVRMPNGAVSGSGGAGAPTPPVNLSQYDCGGPAITFSLLNQLGDGSRDLILSATLIPSSDNLSGASIPMQNDIMPKGFLSFAKPTKIIPSSSSGEFTGSVTMHLEPYISNGVVSLGFTSPPGEAGSGIDYPSNYGEDFRNSFAISINPIGRAMKGKGSGRSVFGKEYAMPESDPIVTLDKDNYTAVYVYNYDKNVSSPYLIMPGDNLLLAFSKYRACISGSAIGSYDFGSPMPNMQHDFWINTGSINITLYGSLVQEGKEFHNTLNSNLTTDSVNEIIYGDETLDQWDVSYREEFTGSYLNSYATGSIDNRKVLFDYSNIDITTTFSAINFADSTRPQWEYCKTFRNANFIDELEFYYDSLVPSFDEILAAQSSSQVPCHINKYTDFGNIKGLIALDSPGAHVQYNNSSYWTKSFPYAHEYSHLSRQKNIAKFFAKKNTNNNLFDPAVEEVSDSIQADLLFTIECHQRREDHNSFYHNIWADYLHVGGAAGNIITGLKKSDLFKILFGFGDFNTCRYGTGFIEDDTKIYGTTNFAMPRNFREPPSSSIEGPFYTLGAYSGPIIRGWKYGLINGLPMNSIAVWRKNRFGQFRDMLEQRLDTKYSVISSIIPSPVEIKFVGPNGKSINPEQTMSSNLSFEATSSLPYFDENVRNREEPISLASIYSMRFST